MKAYILGLVSGLLFFAACEKNGSIEVQTQSRADTAKYLNVNVSQSIFTSADPQIRKSCDVLNAKVRYVTDSLEKSLNTLADTFYTRFAKEGKERPEWNFELYVKDSVFMADGSYISVLLTVYSFQGGAHGMTEFYAFNYDVKKQQFQTPQQILDFRKKAEINKLLQENFVNKDSCFTDIPTLDNGFTALNLNTGTVCFTYPQYVLGPYYCGCVQVSIPRSELKGILLSEQDKKK